MTVRRAVGGLRARIARLQVGDTGYGSAALQRAERAVTELDRITEVGPRAALERARLGSLPLARYQRHLPAVDVRLTGSAGGRMIAEHLDITSEQDGRFRFRGAQPVLRLPEDFDDYLRGRHRQAIRTNINHACADGMFLVSRCEIGWAPGSDDSRVAHISPGPVEKWIVYGPRGEVCADSIISIDDEVALLHGLVSFARYARWLLHTALVERLCGVCRVLLVNSDDVYRTSAGSQHFQRLLGYEIARLRVRHPPLPQLRQSVLPAGRPPLPAVSSARSS